MIDHVSIAVSDLRRSRAFYERCLAPLGYRVLVAREATVGFGKRYPEVWLNHRPGMAAIAADTGAHICLRARDQAAIEAFYHAAMAGGGADAGAPGLRAAAQVTYFGAFTFDPDGNKIEAMTVPPAARAGDQASIA
jgi:catechol 2,3-dioxygenase-like lactoylglutathione lyase family enzyme